MKLNFVLVERDIDDRNDFKALPEINQKQLLIGLSKWYKKKLPIGKALKLNIVSNYWSIVEEGNYDRILYDYWEINRTYGVYFYSNSINPLCIYSNGKLIFEADNRQSLIELGSHLQTSDRFFVDHRKFTFDPDQQVTDFKSPKYIPDSISSWRSLLKKIKVNRTFIYAYSKYFDRKCWNSIGQYSELPIDIIRLYGKKIGWQNISRFQNLSTEMVHQLGDKLDWITISQDRKLTESFIREYHNKVSWDDISETQELSMDLIRDFKARINFQKLKVRSLEIINEFQEEKFNWLDVVNSLEVDEAFARKFHSRFDSKCWSVVSRKSNLSVNFLCEFKDKIDWSCYSQNKYITTDQLISLNEKIATLPVTKRSIINLDDVRMICQKKDVPDIQLVVQTN